MDIENLIFFALIAAYPFALGCKLTSHYYNKSEINRVLSVKDT